MGRFAFQTSAEHEAYCLEIAQAMTIFFGIREEDAVARINMQWGEAKFGNSELLYHRTPDYWAKWIFFGETSWKNMDPVALTSLARIERKLNLMLDHLGLDYTSVNEHVTALVRQGKKLNAISLYQQEVGVSLGKAKEMVEQIQSRLAQERSAEG